MAMISKTCRDPLRDVTTQRESKLLLRRESVLLDRGCAQPIFQPPEIAFPGQAGAFQAQNRGRKSWGRKLRRPGNSTPSDPPVSLLQRSYWQCAPATE